MTHPTETIATLDTEPPLLCRRETADIMGRIEVLASQGDTEVGPPSSVCAQSHGRLLPVEAEHVRDNSMFAPRDEPASHNTPARSGAHPAPM